MGSEVPRTGEAVYPDAPAPHRGAGLYLVALLLGAMAIGFAPIFVRWSETGPSATAFWRLAFSLPPLGVILLRGSAGVASPRMRSAWLLAIFSGLCFGADLVFWHWSIGLTSVANATFETNLSAVFIPLFAWLLFGQRVSRAFVLALLAALVGTALLVGTNAHISPRVLRGDAYGIVSAVFYSGYLLCLKVARDRGAGVAFLMLVSGLVSTLFLLAVALLASEVLVPATWIGWAVLVALALVSQLGGQGLITYALAGVPASFAGLGLLVQPATATAAAWLLLGEHLTLVQAGGGVLLLYGLWLARRQMNGH